MSKFASRKLLAFGIAFAVFLINGLLGTPLPEETAEQLLMALIGYLAAQGVVDATGAISGKEAWTYAAGIIESLQAPSEEEPEQTEE